MCLFLIIDLREMEEIDLSRLESEVYLIHFKRFRGENEKI